MDPLVNVGIKAARRAGNIILRNLDRLDQLSVNKKGRNDFVSEVDRMAEEEIIDIIHKHYPNHAILAEESGDSRSPQGTEQDSEFEWIIDPLDGTTNFLHGNPNFAVSLGIRKNGQIEHGIIFDPLRNEIFSASRGRGAQLNEKRIRVSGRTILANSLIQSGFPSRLIRQVDQWFDCYRVIFPKVSNSLHSGSAALDLVSVACGRSDAYWEPGLNIWDIAAGSLIVREAGGLVSDFQGQQDYLENGYILAATPGIFNELLSYIKPRYS